MLTYERLKEALSYNPVTGIFRWKISSSNCAKVGAVAGGQNPRGYWDVTLDGTLHKAHRLAWFYMKGKWPSKQIDHINGVSHDNRIENLRDVSNRKNQQNQYKHRRGALVGANYMKHMSKWRARITIDGERVYLGYFDTEKKAHEAYLTALKLLEEKNL